MILEIQDVLPYDVFGGIVELFIFLAAAIADSTAFEGPEIWLIRIMVFFLSILIILSFLWITKSVFLVLHTLRDPFTEWLSICGILVLSLFIFTRPVFQPAFYAIAVKTAGSELVAISYIIMDIILWNAWWIAVIIFPTLIIYPEIRKEGLWKHVVGCSLITLILRYLFEFILTFTPLKQYSVFSEGIAYAEPEFNFFYGGMILITLLLAFVSYKILHELEQRVPWIKSCLAIKKQADDF